MKAKRLLSAIISLATLATFIISAPMAFGEVRESNVYRGIDYSAVYDYDFYTRRYPEVYSCFGENREAVLAYFVEYGIDKGHMGSSEFDVNSYKNRYQDLRTEYGNELRSYYMHYIYTGKAELRQALGVSSLQNPITSLDGIDYSAVYDYSYYVSNNKGISECFGEDDAATLKHFIDYGMDMGLVASKEFDVHSYRNLHQDLRLKYGNELKGYYLHYIFSGKDAGRSTEKTQSLVDPVSSYAGVDISTIYDFEYYISHNDEAAELYSNDDIGAIKHFVEKSMPSGLPGTYEYDAEEYEKLHSEISMGYEKARKLLDEIGWDSMAMLGVIAVAKTRFNKKISGAQIREFQSVQDVLAALD